MRTSKAAWVARRATAYVSVAARRARWREYEGYLRLARDRGFDVISLEDWLLTPSRDARVVILRHDVDQDPHSARRMWAVEQAFGVRSTYYFRWSTFDPAVVAEIKNAGFGVGLHHETLTRYAIEHSLRSPHDVTPGVLARCRAELGVEIERFKQLAGACDTVAAHGDRRAHLIGATNRALLDGERLAAYGLRASADAPEAVARCDRWVTDGNGAPTAWANGLSLPQALSSSARVVMFNSHPNHWRAGAPVVGKRVAENLAGFVRAPRGFTWGAPEALAWKRWAPGRVPAGRS